MIKQKNKLYAAVFWLLTAGWMIVIFLFSSRNADDSTTQSNFISDIILSILNKDYKDMNAAEQLRLIKKIEFAVRKSAHFCIYAVLGALSHFSFRFSVRNLKKTYFFSLLVCFLYACTDEIHQLFIPGRSGQFRDVMIDFSGALLSSALIFTAGFIIKKIRTKHK